MEARDSSHLAARTARQPEAARQALRHGGVVRHRRLRRGQQQYSPSLRRDPAGVYRLTSLDKRSVPVTIYNGPYTDPQSGERVQSMVAQVIDGVVGLADDGTYQLAVDLLINADGDVFPVPLTGFGWYEVQGNQVAFTSDAAATGLVGTLGNGTVTLPYPIRGATRKLAFRKAE